MFCEHHFSGSAQVIPKRGSAELDVDNNIFVNMGPGVDNYEYTYVLHNYFWGIFTFDFGFFNIKFTRNIVSLKTLFISF